jgi:hypothetical protein
MLDKRVSVGIEKFPRSFMYSREDHPTLPQRHHPNSRGRSPKTLVGTGKHRGVAEGTGRPSENGGAPDK